MTTENSIIDDIKFELKSSIGGFLFDNKPKLRQEKNYLNLGCGGNILPGLINADFFCGYKFWNRNIPKLEWTLDFRKPLNCPDEAFDGIYSEHTLEHLYPQQVGSLLKELFRILKKGAYIRISVPDIEKYIDYYTENTKDLNAKAFEKKFKTKCQAIINVTQKYKHVSVWDFEEMKSYLESAGFKSPTKRKFRDSEDPNLNLDIAAREYESLYVEAQKQ